VKNASPQFFDVTSNSQSGGITVGQLNYLAYPPRPSAWGMMTIMTALTHLRRLQGIDLKIGALATSGRPVTSRSNSSVFCWLEGSSRLYFRLGHRRCC
jgi:hypothetical protein